MADKYLTQSPAGEFVMFASERRVYLHVREIFALAADYQPSLKETT